MTGLDESGNVKRLMQARRAAAAAAAPIPVRLPGEGPPEVQTTPETGAEIEPKPRAQRRTRLGERWEDRNVRRTFHLPVALVNDVEAVTKELDISLSAAVREALGVWLVAVRVATTQNEEVEP